MIDHVLEPFDDGDETVLIHDPDVAAAKPATSQREILPARK